MFFPVIIAAITLTVLLLSSISDIKTREVPDWLSYGLIISALGIRLIYSVSGEWTIILNGLIGFVICLIIALIFYHTDQWGGGDSKLLMGMGAIIGVNWPFNSDSLNLLYFFLALLFCGAAYGLLWMFYSAVRNHQKFVLQFKKSIKEHKAFHYSVLIVFLAFIVGLIFKFITFNLLLLGILPLFFFTCLFLFHQWKNQVFLSLNNQKN